MAIRRIERVATARDPGLVRVSSPVPGLATSARRTAHPEATVVAVHGGLDRARSFTRIARALPEMDLVAYDRRGYQGSRALGPGTLREHVNDLVSVLASERARTSRPVLALGHSFGGVVVLGAAIAAPELLDHAVIFEAPLPWVLARDDSPAALPTDPALAAEAFFTRMVSARDWERLSEIERGSRRLDGPALMSDLAALRTAAPYTLATLEVATTFAFGHWARTPHFRELARLVGEITPLMTFVEVADARHDAHLRRPDALAALVRHACEVSCASA